MYRIFLFSLLFIGSCAKQTPQDDLIISNINLIDGTGADLRANVNIHIKDGKIVRISNTPIDQHENVIEGTGKYLIPGLFDGHAHTGDFERDFPRFTHYGITSIFIPGGSTCTNEYYTSMRTLGEQDSIPAPHVFHTSQHFSMEGRHPSKTYASSNWRDGESIFFLKDTAQIELLVKQVAQYPIAGIKLTIEDGPAPPFVERIPQRFIDKTVKEASKYDLEVFAHVSDNIELEMAMRAGVQNLVHFTGVNIDLEDDDQLALIEEFKNRDPSWVTTLMIDKSFLYPLHPEWFEVEEMLPEYRSFADSLTTALITRANIYVKILEEEYGIKEGSLSAFVTPQAEDIQFLNQIGINMVLGTDTGNDFNFAGYSLHEEMQLLEMGGMKPNEIIKMGTHNAAKMLKMLDKLGTIEEGKIADMVLLDKNPLDEIKNTLSIHAVIKGGVIQDRIQHN